MFLQGECDWRDEELPEQPEKIAKGVREDEFVLLKHLPYKYGKRSRCFWYQTTHIPQMHLLYSVRIEERFSLVCKMSGVDEEFCIGHKLCGKSSLPILFPPIDNGPSWERDVQCSVAPCSKSRAAQAQPTRNVPW